MRLQAADNNLYFIVQATTTSSGMQIRWKRDDYRDVAFFRLSRPALLVWHDLRIVIDKIHDIERGPVWLGAISHSNPSRVSCGGEWE